MATDTPDEVYPGVWVYMEGSFVVIESECGVKVNSIRSYYIAISTQQTRDVETMRV